MRLFTHNFLQCHVKGCTTDNFPLAISDATVAVKEAEFNRDFMANYMVKVDWAVLLETAAQLGIACDLPADAPAVFDDETLERIHHILMEHSVTDGRMTCKGCGHIYLIKDGIPNMLLSEDEV